MIAAVANKTILELRREMRALSSFMMMIYLQLMVIVYCVASVRHDRNEDVLDRMHVAYARGLREGAHLVFLR